MLIHVDEISPVKKIVLNGDEPWLKPIAESISESQSSNTAGKITATLNFKKDSAGFIYGSGTIEHTPLLICGRCDLEVPWPITAKVQVTWRPPYESHAPHELTLTAEDLDIYFIENNSIDLEQLVIDTLLCSIPSQMPVRRDDTDDCGICGKNLDSELVYGEQSVPVEKKSPFAILKDLKL